MHVKEVVKAQYQPNHAVPIDAFRAKIGNQLGTVAQREENWDEYESKKPSALALNNAKRLMEELLDRIISAGHSWLTPFISSDEDGHVTVEWYSGDWELHFIIREQEAVYIKGNCLVQSRTCAPTGNRDLEIAPTLRSCVGTGIKLRHDEPTFPKEIDRLNSYHKGMGYKHRK